MSKNRSPNHALTEYARESARPLVSLTFVAPILLAYEAGVLLLGPQTMRNGADVWLRQLLELIGFGQYFLLPILTCAILLAWHHTSHQPWRLRAKVLTPMICESAMFAVLLLVFARVQYSVMESMSLSVEPANPSLSTAGAHVVAYFGAGIYEELLFRLMMIPAAIGLLRMMGYSISTSTIGAVIATSLLFSAAHYDFVTSGGQPFELFSFSFRFLAGVFFAALFVYRGFGITVGVHAAYDILAAVL